MSDKDDMLREAAAQFRKYEQSHRAKGTPDGDEKADTNAQWAENCEKAARGSPDDLLNDRKFKIVDGRLVNRVSGVAIPEHEPVFIFRARDRYLQAVLAFYRTLVSVPGHRKAIEESEVAVAAFARQYPQEMKEPGITGDFKHAEPTKPSIDRLITEESSMITKALWTDGEVTVINHRNDRFPLGSLDEARARHRDHRFPASTS